MNPRFSSHSTAALLSLALITAALAGCNRNDAKVFTVPKETPPAPVTAALPPGHPDTGGMSMGGGMGAGMGMDASLRPRLGYQKPAGWVEADPGAMRVASFKISQNGKQADVSVIPLSGVAGGDLANVNRWRGQIGLEPASEEELKKAAQPVEVAGAPALLYELSGKNPGSGEPVRVLGVIQHREETAWFFKVTGDDPTVAAQKPALVEFLKTVTFEAPEAVALPPSHPPIGGAHPPMDAMAMPGSMMGAAPGPISREGQPSWQIPSGWQEVAGGEFLIAKFLISGEANAQAAVNVSASAGDGGGLANNVNRWRKQLGLADQTEAEIAKEAKSIDVAGGKAALVEISGTDARTSHPARLVGSMVERGGQTWFYKLMGEDKLVAAQKDAFIRFVQSVKYGAHPLP